ncbi:MAG: GPW/gp25 family protein [Cytophagales bacterium]|nr:GPW/gp25 family protein [Cytophagales bacterium]
MINKSENIFLGKGWAFPPQFDAESKEAVMVSDKEDIEESLKILLKTKPGERIMYPKYGCKIFQYVYEQISETLFTEIKEAVRWAIIDFEPRIDLVDVQISYSPEENMSLVRINIIYIIRQINSRHNLVYPFYLMEGTNI